MKKSMFLLVVTTAISLPALSQGWRITPTVGLNGSAALYSAAFRNDLNALNSGTAGAVRTGVMANVQVGALLDYAFGDRFSIRSGLIYTGKGTIFRISEYQNGGSVTVPVSYQLSYAEIPLLLNIAIGDNGLRLIGGPVVGITLNGKFVVDAGNYGSYGYYGGSTRNLRIGSNRTDNILPTDLSVSIGLLKELEVGNRPLEIGLHVQPSISKWNTISKYKPDYYGRNLLVGLRVAYLFELRR